jgi:hypothetical protein
MMVLMVLMMVLMMVLVLSVLFDVVVVVIMHFCLASSLLTLALFVVRVVDLHRLCHRRRRPDVVAAMRSSRLC